MTTYLWIFLPEDFAGLAGTVAGDLFADSAIIVYEAMPGGEPVKGSLAEHARLS